MAKPDDINNPVVTVSANTNTNIEALINSYHYKWSGQSISYRDRKSTRLNSSH